MPTNNAAISHCAVFYMACIFCMWIYTTAGIAQNTFGTTDTTSKVFQDAGDWVGVMFMVYNGVSAITAFLLPVLAKANKQEIHPHALSCHWRHLAYFHVLY